MVYIVIISRNEFIYLKIVGKPHTHYSQECKNTFLTCHSIHQPTVFSILVLNVYSREILFS